MQDSVEAARHGTAYNVDNIAFADIADDLIAGLAKIIIIVMAAIYCNEAVGLLILLLTSLALLAPSFSRSSRKIRLSEPPV